MRIVAAVVGGLMFFATVSYFLPGTPADHQKPASALGSPAVTNVDDGQKLADINSSAHSPSAHSEVAPSPSRDAGVNSAIPIPGPLPQTLWAGPEQIVLWKNQYPPSTSEQDGIEQINLQLDPAHLVSLHPGQTLILPLPDGAPEVRALVTHTFNDVNGTHNWRAQVQNDLPNASVLITQGSEKTHIAIFTEQASYTLIADNKTGKATLVDEGKLIARQAMVDDGVVVQEHPEVTPPL